MKTTLFIILFTICLVRSTFSISCNKGFYDNTAAHGKCSQCSIYYTQCTNTGGTPNSKLKGYDLVNGALVNWCETSTYYNSEKKQCEQVCKDGCYNCRVDYDFCDQCHSGYVWNPDYTCLPAIIGLQAASLALLAIALVFSVIGCCYVNKARK